MDGLRRRDLRDGRTEPVLSRKRFTALVEAAADLHRHDDCYLSAYHSGFDHRSLWRRHRRFRGLQSWTELNYRSGLANYSVARSFLLCRHVLRYSLFLGAGHSPEMEMDHAGIAGWRAALDWRIAAVPRVSALL